MPNDGLNRSSRVQMITELLEQNLSQAEIAQRLHISRARVGQVALAQGLSNSKRRASRPLTRRQASILAFVREFTASNSYPPTVREIMAGCKLSSTSVTDYNLLHLKDRGYLVRVSGIARGIILTEQGKAVETCPLDSLRDPT